MVFNETTVHREELIRQEFSDRVIIVDEAHHLRSTQDAIEANDALIYSEEFNVR
jgi:Rad3-related DNA helicase